MVLVFSRFLGAANPSTMRMEANVMISTGAMRPFECRLDWLDWFTLLGDLPPLHGLGMPWESSRL